MTPIGKCPFCELSERELISENDTACAFLDCYPVSKGHSLIVPTRHVASIYELASDQQKAIWKLVGQVREVLSVQFDPDGFNIGLNDGEAAGQTVGHAHVHVIPRYVGDLPDPRGGVRWVIPSKANYWGKDK